MKKKLIILSGLVLGLAPVSALAASTGGFTACKAGVVQANATTIETILCKIGDIFNTVIPIVIALGAVYFVWGVISYVVAGDEEAKTKGRDRMIYGIIGLAVIISLWGLVFILIRTFGLDYQKQDITFPTTPY